VSETNAPIITFLTDFGLSDGYVAEMKAAVLRDCPSARLVDVTHLIAPQDVLAGSIALERAVRSFPAGTVHVAVVDPGVGSDRKLIVASVNGQTIFAPDNGLITWPFRLHADVATHELLWRPAETPSLTFHGRDIIAPAAALQASGSFDPAWLGRMDRPVLLDVDIARSLADARVLHIDHYGNVTTNVPAAMVSLTTRIKGVGAVGQTYADVPPGRALGLIGSSGLLEIAIRNGSAADRLGLQVGQNLHVY